MRALAAFGAALRMVWASAACVMRIFLVGSVT